MVTLRPGPIAGWLFTLSGAALLICAVLIPTADDLDGARWQLKRTLALETHALDRIQRHERYLAALDEQDAGLTIALAGAQLNLIPAGNGALIAPGRPADLDLFASIEPPPPADPPRIRAGSILEYLTTDPSIRLWVIAGSAVVILIGLLPASRGGA